MILPCVVFAMAGGPRLIMTEGVVANETHRFAKIDNDAGVGRLRAQVKPLLADIAEIRGGHCGAPVNNMLYFGSPPASCRRGKVYRGTTANGFVEVIVSTRQTYSHALVRQVVRYPAKEPGELIETYKVGPFARCFRGSPSDKFVDHYCVESMDVSYFIDGNVSTAWITDSPSTTNNYLSVYCAVQVFILGMLAASNKVGSDRVLLQLAADSAVGGGLFQAVTVGRGITVVGLADEIGDDNAAFVSTVVAIMALSQGVLAWVIALTVSGTTKLEFTAPLPLAVVRECLEVPIMLTLPAMWPPALGRNFALTMNFAIGLAVPTVAGRAVCRLTNSQSFQLWGAAMMLIAFFSGATLTLPALALSGGVVRGNPSLVLTATLAIHCTLAGYFATAIRQRAAA